jgi:hypothetical protein
MIQHMGRAWNTYFHVIEKAETFGNTSLVMTTEMNSNSFTDKDQSVYGFW